MEKEKYIKIINKELKDMTPEKLRLVLLAVLHMK